MKEPTVISLGGSLIVPNGGIDHKFLKRFCQLILRFVDEGSKFLIVAGGGKTCRHYQEAARRIVSLDDEDVDWLGIHTTRLNAHLLRTIFREYAHPKVLTHYDEKEDIQKPIVIAAGWKPGHSTDYDAVMFASLYDINTVINLSDVRYVFDKDPDKFKDAKPLKELSWDDYRKMVGESWDPGSNFPFDPIASKQAQEVGIQVIVMDGKNLKNFENFLLDRPFEGTVVS